MPLFLDSTGLSKLLQKIKTVFATKTELVEIRMMVPVGSIFYLAYSSVPAGYLVCNGQAVSRTEYSDLFAAIGTAYGTGNGSTTFNVPNLIDRFPQGSATPGTVKNAGLPNIAGGNLAFPDVGGQETATGGPLYVKSNGRVYVNWGNSNVNAYDVNVGFDASKANSIYGASSTVQPPALTLVPVIRAIQ